MLALEPDTRSKLGRQVEEVAREHGLDLELLDRDQTRAMVDSPLYRGGVLDRDGVVLVDPCDSRSGDAGVTRCHRFGGRRRDEQFVVVAVGLNEAPQFVWIVG